MTYQVREHLGMFGLGYVPTMVEVQEMMRMKCKKGERLYGTLIAFLDIKSIFFTTDLYPEVGPCKEFKSLTKQPNESTGFSHGSQTIQNLNN